MPAVRVMQVPGHQVVAVIGVRDDLVATARAVSMRLVMLATRVRRRARRRVCPSGGQRTLVDVVVVQAVEMAVVQVVRVVTVLDSRVPAAGPMRMIVSTVGMVLSHVVTSS
jgi:hypothetical protein